MGTLGQAVSNVSSPLAQPADDLFDIDMKGIDFGVRSKVQPSAPEKIDESPYSENDTEYDKMLIDKELNRASRDEALYNGDYDDAATPSVPESQKYGMASSFSDEVRLSGGGRALFAEESFSDSVLGGLAFSISGDDNDWYSASIDEAKIAKYMSTSGFIDKVATGMIPGFIGDLPIDMAIMAFGGPLGVAGVVGKYANYANKSLKLAKATKDVNKIARFTKHLSTINKLRRATRSGIGKVSKYAVAEFTTGMVTGLTSAFAQDVLGKDMLTSDYNARIIGDAIGGTAFAGLLSGLKKSFGSSFVVKQLEKVGIKKKVAEEVVDDIGNEPVKLDEATKHPMTKTGADGEEIKVTPKEANTTSGEVRYGDAEDHNGIVGVVDKDEWRKDHVLSSFYDAFKELTGIDTLFVKADDGSTKIRGSYSKNALVINSLLSTPLKIRTMGHELFHYSIDSLSAGEQKTTLDAMYNVLFASKSTKEAVLSYGDAGKLESLKGTELSSYKRELVEEFMADRGGNYFAENLPKLMKNMSGTKEGQKAFGKIMDSIKKFVTGLRSYLDSRMTGKGSEKVKAVDDYVSKVMDSMFSDKASIELKDFLSGKSDSYLKDVDFEGVSKADTGGDDITLSGVPKVEPIIATVRDKKRPLTQAEKKKNEKVIGESFGDMLAKTEKAKAAAKKIKKITTLIANEDIGEGGIDGTGIGASKKRKRSVSKSDDYDTSDVGRMTNQKTYEEVFGHGDVEVDKFTELEGVTDEYRDKIREFEENNPNSDLRGGEDVNTVRYQNKQEKVQIENSEQLDKVAKEYGAAAKKYFDAIKAIEKQYGVDDISFKKAMSIITDKGKEKLVSLVKDTRAKKKALTAWTKSVVDARNKALGLDKDGKAELSTDGKPKNPNKLTRKKADLSKGKDHIQKYIEKKPEFEDKQVAMRVIMRDIKRWIDGMASEGTMSKEQGELLQSIYMHNFSKNPEYARDLADSIRILRNESLIAENMQANARKDLDVDKNNPKSIDEMKHESDVDRFLSIKKRNDRGYDTSSQDAYWLKEVHKKNAGGTKTSPTKHPSGVGREVDIELISDKASKEYLDYINDDKPIHRDVRTYKEEPILKRAKKSKPVSEGVTKSTKSYGKDIMSYLDAKGKKKQKFVAVKKDYPSGKEFEPEKYIYYEPDDLDGKVKDKVKYGIEDPRVYGVLDADDILSNVRRKISGTKKRKLSKDLEEGEVDWESSEASNIMDEIIARIEKAKHNGYPKHLDENDTQLKELYSNASVLLGGIQHEMDTKGSSIINESDSVAKTIGKTISDSFSKIFRDDYQGSIKAGVKVDNNTMSKYFSGTTFDKNGKLVPGKQRDVHMKSNDKYSPSDPRYIAGGESITDIRAIEPFVDVMLKAYADNKPAAAGGTRENLTMGEAGIIRNAVIRSFDKINTKIFAGENAKNITAKLASESKAKGGTLLGRLKGVKYTFSKWLQLAMTPMDMLGNVGAKAGDSVYRATYDNFREGADIGHEVIKDVFDTMAAKYKENGLGKKYHQENFRGAGKSIVGGAEKLVGKYKLKTHKTSFGDITGEEALTMSRAIDHAVSLAVNHGDFRLIRTYQEDGFILRGDADSPNPKAYKLGGLVKYASFMRKKLTNPYIKERGGVLSVKNFIEEMEDVIAKSDSGKMFDHYKSVLNDSGKRAGDTVGRITGLSMDMKNGFVPLMSVGSEHVPLYDTSRVDGFGDSVNFHTMFDDSAAPNGKPFIIDPMANIVAKTVMDTTRFATDSSAIRWLSQIHNDKSIVGNFDSVAGKDYHNYMAKLIGHIRNPETTDIHFGSHSEFGKWAYNAQTIYALGANVKNAAIQYVSTVFLKQTYGNDIFFKNIHSGITSYEVGFNEMMKHSGGQLKHRLVTATGSADLMDLSKRNPIIAKLLGGGSIAGKTVSEWSVSMMHAVDSRAMVTNWNMAKDLVSRDFPDLSGKEYWKMVNDVAMKEVDRSQPTGSTYMRTPYQRDNNPIIRMSIGRFSSATGKIGSMGAAAIRDAIVMKDYKSFAEFSQYMLVSSMMIAAADVAYSQAGLAGGDKRDRRKFRQKQESIMKTYGIILMGRMLGINAATGVVGGGLASAMGEVQYTNTSPGQDALAALYRSTRQTANFLSGNYKDDRSLWKANLNLLNVMGFPINNFMKSFAIAPRGVYNMVTGKAGQEEE